MPDSHPIAQAKHQLRKQALACRSALPIERISQGICEKLALWEEFQQASQVLFYFPFRNEVDLRPLCHRYPEKAWYLPAILPSQALEFRLIDAKFELEDGKYGISAPSAQAQAWQGECGGAVLLVPGLLFDSHGYRVGYGKGYYDRFLSQGYRLPKVGIAPHALMQEALPHDPWDVPMDFLCSERGVRAVIPRNTP